MFAATAAIALPLFSFKAMPAKTHQDILLMRWALFSVAGLILIVALYSLGITPVWARGLKEAMASAPFLLPADAPSLSPGTGFLLCMALTLALVYDLLLIRGTLRKTAVLAAFLLLLACFTPALGLWGFFFNAVPCLLSAGARARSPSSGHPLPSGIIPNLLPLMNNLDYPIPVLELVTALKQLPGIGIRGAERMALWMLQGHMGEAEAIARTIGQAAEHVTPCPVCGFFSTEGEPCAACRDEERDSRLICVVEQATDVIPIERSSAYRGLYHCLGGKLSPLDDVEPEDLNIQSLVERVSRQSDCEVILATGSDVEGEATATYLHHLLKEMDCRISRPAQGLPAGSGLSHADTLTLMKALEGRTRL